MNSPKAGADFSPLLSFCHPFWATAGPITLADLGSCLELDGEPLEDNLQASSYFIITPAPMLSSLVIYLSSQKPISLPDKPTTLGKLKL